jgi:hypothetical protein
LLPILNPIYTIDPVLMLIESVQNFPMVTSKLGWGGGREIQNISLPTSKEQTRIGQFTMKFISSLDHKQRRYYEKKQNRPNHYFSNQGREEFDYILHSCSRCR